jgi:hypothetical protein
MSTLEDVRTLRATALRLLPGFCQARAQMNIAVKVLEYFARDAEHELSTGHYTPPPVDPQIEGDIRVMQALIHVFRRIHQPRD